MVAGKLTIIQVLPELEEGGVEGETVDLAVYLAAQGHRSIVISGGGRMVERLEHAGCEHIRWPYIGEKSGRCLQYIPRLRTLLMSEKVDVLHLRSRLPAWVAYIAWKLLPKGSQPVLITTFHGFHSINCYSAIMSRGERVVAVSEVIRQHILDNYRVDPQKIHVIYGGFAGETFAPERVSADRVARLQKRWLAGRNDIPVIMLPGRFTRLKGHGTLIESLALLGDRRFVCLLVGDTEENPPFITTLKSQIEKLGLSDKVLFTGHCDDMPAALLLADVVVSASSTRPEAFGKVAIEAMAMGKPVVATAHGGSLEIVVPGETGWLVPPLDAQAMSLALAASLDDPAKSAELGRQGQLRARAHFTARVMCEKTVDLYQETLGARTREK